MDNAVLQTIANRRSHRRYLPQQLTQQQLDAIIDAALQSPSGMNHQPWHFSVVQNPQVLKDISAAARAVDATLPEEERSKRFQDPDFQIFYSAPTAILVWVEKGSHYALVDCGIAVQSMALAAQSLGLGSVILGRPLDVFNSPRGEYYERKMRFPEGNQFAISIAVGRPTLSKNAHKFREGRITRV